jgi:asparagine N-glycosylation enzyme membrane subunit Stt3
MTTDPGSTTSTTSTTGRQVTLTPVPPGTWLIIGGGVVAALGPLFGFLIGSMLGSTTDTGDLGPIYLFLFAGIVLGGLGVVAVLLGVRRVIRDRQGMTAG